MFLSAMRSHADAVRAEYGLHYEVLNSSERLDTYEDKLTRVLACHPQVKTITTYEIEDHFFRDRMARFCQENTIELEVVDSPGFLISTEEFTQYNQHVKKPFMHTFYQRQRKAFDILVDEGGQPLGGQWSFDQDNRKKLPRDLQLPGLPQINHTEHTSEVIEMVNNHFPDHPGRTTNFNWATTRPQVLSLMQTFFEDRFALFGPYEDAIDRKEAFLFHSTLSPYINMGLITPGEVVEAAIEHAQNHDVPLPSLEGFVRQVIGWREFMRGIYHQYDDRLNVNYFNHRRQMNPCWYDGTTGIDPLDDSIKKALENGYTHHIERLMVLGNLMLLCELNPEEVYKWFMEMYVDSADWVMAPNVFGMSQYADGGIFSTKPYIGGANYILKMSNYSKNATWPAVVTGLYWRFIIKHYDLFKSNPRMSMMTRALDKMGTEQKEAHVSIAEAFIEKVTH